MWGVFMFAVLKIKKNETNIFTKIKLFFRPVEPELSRVEVKGAMPFYYLEIYENQCGEYFEIIPQLLGRCAHNLIVCDKYLLPKNQNIDYFRPKKLPQIALINTAVDFLKTNVSDKAHFSLALIDENAIFTDFIYLFIEYASTINVLTNHPDKYESVAGELYNEWGVSLVITPSYSLIEDCNLIICPSKNNIKEYSQTIVFKNNFQKKVYTVEEIDLPEKYNEIKPNGVDNLIFASALYELCGADDLKRIKYNKMLS